jgi:hypothetical protein
MKETGTQSELAVFPGAKRGTCWKLLRLEGDEANRVSVSLLAGARSGPNADGYSSSNEIECDARNDVKEKDPDLIDRDPGNVERVE